jgi:hypothetical protein
LGLTMSRFPICKRHRSYSRPLTKFSVTFVLCLLMCTCYVLDHGCSCHGSIGQTSWRSCPSIRSFSAWCRASSPESLAKKRIRRQSRVRPSLFYQTQFPAITHPTGEDSTSTLACLTFWSNWPTESDDAVRSFITLTPHC